MEMAKQQICCFRFNIFIMDYTIFYKTSFDNGNIDCGEGYDFFFSAYDACERTITIFDKIKSNKKVWIDFPHYKNEFTDNNVYRCCSFREDECFINLFNSVRKFIILFSNFLSFT